MATKNLKLASEKEKILKSIAELYLAEGFYKTSMDSISSTLRISKKTIYKYFPSKEQLVQEVAFSIINSTGYKIDTIIQQKENALNKIFNVFNILGDTVMKFSDKWLNDLRTHTPEVWKQIDEFRTKKMFVVMSSLLEQGKKEGLVADIPSEIMVLLLVSSVRSIVNPDFLYHNKFSYKEAVQVTFEIFFNGVLTTPGRKQFKSPNFWKEK